MCMKRFLAHVCTRPPEYEGLFRDIAMKAMPTPEETRAFVFDFPTARSFGGFREAMVVIPRRHDALKKLEPHDWAADAAHPDVDALNEATQLADTFAVTSTMAEIYDRPADFHGWLDAAKSQSAELRDAIRAMRAGGDATALERSKKSFAALTKTCTDCHTVYRNH